MDTHCGGCCFRLDYWHCYRGAADIDRMLIQMSHAAEISMLKLAIENLETGHVREARSRILDVVNILAERDEIDNNSGGNWK